MTFKGHCRFMHATRSSIGANGSCAKPYQGRNPTEAFAGCRPGRRTTSRSLLSLTGAPSRMLDSQICKLACWHHSSSADRVRAQGVCLREPCLKPLFDVSDLYSFHSRAFYSVSGRAGHLQSPSPKGRVILTCLQIYSFSHLGMRSLSTSETACSTKDVRMRDISSE